MLALQVYGHFTPVVSFKQHLGYESHPDGKEQLLVYVMTRMRGISRLDFVLTYGFPEHSHDNLVRRENLVRDMARYDRLCSSVQ